MKHTIEQDIQQLYIAFFRQHTSDDALLENLVGASSCNVDLDDLDEMLEGFSEDSWGRLDSGTRRAQLVKLQQQAQAIKELEGKAASKVVTAASPLQGAVERRDAPNSHCAAAQHAANSHSTSHLTGIQSQSDGAGNALESAELSSALFPRETSSGEAAAADAQAQETESKANPVAAAVSEFLRRNGGAQLQDEAVSEYLQAMLRDRTDSDGAAEVDQLDTILCGFAPDTWAQQQEAERQMHLCDLLADISNLQLETQPQSAGTAQPVKPNPMRQQSSQRQRDAGSAAAASQHADQNREPEADAASVATLAELCSGAASQEYLAHLLVHTCHGDLQAAAQALLEVEDVRQQEAAWRAAQAQAAAEAARREQQERKERQRICARFDLQAVPLGNSGSGHRQKREPVVDAWQAVDDGRRGNVRYRDGQLVSTRGEKYILEKKEEYDGGSRGRVKTKGKRGVGFA